MMDVNASLTPCLDAPDRSRSCPVRPKGFAVLANREPRRKWLGSLGL